MYPYDMVDFRVMTREDKMFFTQLMDMVGWGMTPQDYSRMLKFSPDGLFIASIDGFDLGMISTINYGKIAWIGNLVVLPNSRGKGIGEGLMMKSMEYLKGEGVESIKLDSVQLAIPLYRRLGFRDEYRSLRYKGVASENRVSTPIQMKVEDLKIVGEYDQSVFKAPRHNLLRYVYKKNPELAFTAWDSEKLVGYIMAKYGKFNVKIGPWQSESPEIAEELLYSVMNQVVGYDLWVGLPEGNTHGVSILEKLGFSANPSSLRMCYGDCSVVENVEKVYGLGGPDKG